MPHEQTKTVYYFDELSDKAKDKARDWFREGALDYDWYGTTFEDAVRVANTLGIITRTQHCVSTGGRDRRRMHLLDLKNSPASAHRSLAVVPSNPKAA